MMKKMKIIFSGPTLSIPCGTIGGCKSRSVAGKATLVGLTLGLLEQSRIEVLVDGLSIHKNLPRRQSKIGCGTHYIF